MRILVVAATEFELAGLIAEIGRRPQASGIPIQEINFLITGVGMVATAFALGKHLATSQYDLVINLGIAGSFERTIPLGQVLEVTQDQLSELGAEDDEAFLPIETLGFGQSIFKNDARVSSYAGIELKQASAITVNTVHGRQSSIQRLTSRIQAQLESMEGAAVFYACRNAAVPCLQIRAVSNYVEKRNRDGWQIALAIKNLNNFALEFFERLVRNAK